MKEELDKRLCQRYPLLYRHRHRTPQETPLAFGFECGDGWYDLLDRVSAKLEQEIHRIRDGIPSGLTPQEVLDQLPAASQVKEKFGGLRFYMSSYTEGMEPIIREAEEAACKTCEECGRPGRIETVRGWRICRCPMHLQEEIRRYEQMQRSI